MSSTRECKKHGALPIEKFCIYTTSDRNRTITRYDCKLCAADKRGKHKEYYVEWRKNNKKKLKKYWKINAKRKSDIIRKYLIGYLTQHSCVDCPEKDMLVLEFDHVRGKKKYNISNMISRGLSIKIVEKEIAKCEVRCANCHRRKTILALGKRCYKNVLVF